MTRRMDRSRWIGILLAAVLTLCLWNPQAQASEAVDKSADIVEISEDDTVTLISGHLAEEKLSSLQLELKVEGGEAGFQFSESLGDRLKYCSHGDGTLRLFIAGSEPLLAEGETSLVLGTVTGEGVRVTPVEGSLQFVRGTRMAAQTLAEAKNQEPDPTPTPYQPPEGGGAGERTPTITPDQSQDRADAGTRLRAELDSAAALYGAGDTRYTQDSWGVLLMAVEQATQLLDRGDASQAELEAALEQLRAAIRGLVPIGRAALGEAVTSAKAYAAAEYTQDSYRALQDAIANADAVLADPAAGETAWSAALARLQEAIDRLVPYTGADSNGKAIPDGPDGGSGGADDSPATPAPVPTPSAAPSGGGKSGSVVAPNTGDETALLPWIALLALSGTGLILLVRRRRKSR